MEENQKMADFGFEMILFSGLTLKLANFLSVKYMGGGERIKPISENKQYLIYVKTRGFYNEKVEKKINFVIFDPKKS